MSGDIRAYGQTDVGRVRSDNEDAFFIDEKLGVFGVADGMGGHAFGEVASRLAVEALEEVWNETASDDEPESVMSTGYDLANARIRDEVARDGSRHGMGTTLVTAWIADGSLLVANVGDSRSYLIRDGEIRQLTTDHSWVREQVDSGRLDPDEAHHHPYRNVITRALGSRDDVDVDFVEEPLAPGDRILLCSDGLTGMVPDDRILEIVHDREDLPSAVEALIHAANEAGGEDNITAVLISYGASS